MLAQRHWNLAFWQRRAGVCGVVLLQELQSSMLTDWLQRWRERGCREGGREEAWHWLCVISCRKEEVKESGMHGFYLFLCLSEFCVVVHFPQCLSMLSCIVSVFLKCLHSCLLFCCPSNEYADDWPFESTIMHYKDLIMNLKHSLQGSWHRAFPEKRPGTLILFYAVVGLRGWAKSCGIF